MKNYEVLDQFFAAQVACNESEETLKALRPQVEEAVQALIAERGLPCTSFRLFSKPLFSTFFSNSRVIACIFFVKKSSK